MRVELYDYVNQVYRIDSEDAETVGRWAAEHFRNLVNANAAIGPIRMNIWPSNEKEMKCIGQHAERLTQDGLLYFAGVILNASQELALIEDARERQPQ